MPNRIDSHAHLYNLDSTQLEETISCARKNDVKLIMNVSTSIYSCEIVLDQCKKYSELIPAIGISPFDVNNAEKQWENILKNIIKSSKVFAIGETGLDTSNPKYPDINLQKAFFEKQIALSLEENLPLIVHSRGCEKKVLDICVYHKVKKVIFHCYTGSWDVLKLIIDAGYFVSFSGIVTFKNSEVLYVAQKAPLDFMLLETDSPYLAPHPFRGEKNQPAWVSIIAKKIAQIKNINENELSYNICNNFYKLFGIKI